MSDLRSVIRNVRSAVLDSERVLTHLRQSNRERQAEIISRESSISERRHRLDYAELRMIHSSDGINDTMRGNERLKSFISEGNDRLSLLRRAIRNTALDISELDTQLTSVHFDDISAIKASVSARRARLSHLREEEARVSLESDSLDQEREALESLAQSSAVRLDRADKRVSGLRLLLETPIDDLQLEKLVTDSAESSCQDLSLEPIDGSEMVVFEETREVEELEQLNVSRKARISVRPRRHGKEPQSPLFVKAPRFAATQVMKRAGDEEDRRVSDFALSFTEFEKRQSEVDATERDTTAVKECYAEDQRQIENSWAYKMDDVQALQVQVNESEDLVWQIEEMKTNIMELGSMYDMMQSKARRLRKYSEEAAARLDALDEVHPFMEAKVLSIVERKRSISVAGTEIKERRRRMEAEERKLEKMLKRYRLRKEAVLAVEQETETLREDNDEGARSHGPVHRKGSAHVGVYRSALPVAKPLKNKQAEGTGFADLFPAPADFSTDDDEAGDEIFDSTGFSGIAPIVPKRILDRWSSSDAVSCESDDDDGIGRVVEAAHEALDMPLSVSKIREGSSTFAHF